MTFKQFLFPIAAASVLALGGCEAGNNNVIDTWNIATDAQGLKVDMIFNPSYIINGEATMPFKDYGNISVYQTSDARTAVGFDLKLSAFADTSLQSVNSLPTGSAFPSLVTGGMNTVEIFNDPSKWSGSVYFADQTDPDGTQRRLVGMTMAFGALKTNFGNLTVTQNYFNSAKRKYAAATIYGPQFDAAGNVTVPGGVFIVADINMVTTRSSGKVFAGTDLDISGDKARDHKSPKSKQLLAMQMLKAFEDAGIILKKK